LVELQQMISTLLRNINEMTVEFEEYAGEVDLGFANRYQKILSVLSYIFIGGQRPQVIYEMDITVSFSKK
jgi:hypothetical protein